MVKYKAKRSLILHSICTHLIKRMTDQHTGDLGMNIKYFLPLFNLREFHIQKISFSFFHIHCLLQYLCIRALVLRNVF